MKGWVWGAGAALAAFFALGLGMKTPQAKEPSYPPKDMPPAPPLPGGWLGMPQGRVTPNMTLWAVSILHDTAGHPMFSTDTRDFDGETVLARVEWHPPDPPVGPDHIHRGVSLYTRVADGNA